MDLPNTFARGSSARLRSADTSGARFCLTQNQITWQLGPEVRRALLLEHRFALRRASDHGSLAAISVAATLFGGLTYIGNSPNLLIRAIAESRHVPTPGFLAYIIKDALPFLIPVLGLVGLIFFRG